MLAPCNNIAPTVNAHSLDYGTLRSHLKVGLRRGTWAGLVGVEKALYRCALWLARTRGRITSTRLLAIVYEIVRKLTATRREQIYRLGTARAQSLWNTYELARVFEWAPEIKMVLSRADYVTYLGVMELNR